MDKTVRITLILSAVAIVFFIAGFAGCFETSDLRNSKMFDAISDRHSGGGSSENSGSDDGSGFSIDPF